MLVINLSQIEHLLQAFELNYTNSQIGGVWDFPRVPSWLLSGASSNKMAENQLYD